MLQKVVSKMNFAIFQNTPFSKMRKSLGTDENHHLKDKWCDLCVGKKQEGFHGERRNGIVLFHKSLPKYSHIKQNVDSSSQFYDTTVITKYMLMKIF